MTWFGDRDSIRRGTNSDRMRRRLPRRPDWEIMEDRCVPTVTYHGGYVLPHVEAQSIFYGNLWNSLQYAGKRQTLDNFIKYAVTSTFMDGLTRAGYGVGEGSARPGVVIPAALAKGANLSDKSIQVAIQNAITSKKVQAPDHNSLYIVWVQPNVVVTSGGENSVNDFDGYHDAFLGKDAAGHSLEINYAVLPYPTGGGGASVIDDLTSTAAHELAESATDPGVNSTAWYDDQLDGEIGDFTQDTTARQDGWNFQLVVGKYGHALPLNGFSKLPKTTTTLSSSASRIGAGQAETFTVRVGQVTGTQQPAGQVILLEDGVIIATLNLNLLNGKETARFTTTRLAKGVHTLTAFYNGNGGFREGFSNSLSVTVG